MRLWLRPVTRSVRSLGEMISFIAQSLSRANFVEVPDAIGQAALTCPRPDSTTKVSPPM